MQNSREHKVVLLDLDGTLMDSEKAREDGWKLAIDCLYPCLVTGNDEKAKDYLTGIALGACRALYAANKELAKLGQTLQLDLPDLRQEWNPPIFYGLLLAWWETGLPHLPESALTFSLSSILAETNRAAGFVRRAIELSSADNIDHASYIDDACAAFWRAELRPFPGTIDLLRKLRDEGIRYYIATEGHLPTQWRKIVQLGLGPGSPSPPDPIWVSPGQLLATSQAALPTAGLDSLHELINWHCTAAESYRRAQELLGDGSAPGSGETTRSNYSALENEIAAELRSVEGMKQIIDLFGRLKMKASTYQDGGVRPDFFYRVLYAINQDPDNPRARFRTFDLSWKAEHLMRVAMVGDNPSSDMKPILRAGRELDSRIMAIWIKKQSRHGRNYTGDWDEGDRPIEVDSIAQAGTYLLDSNAWTSHTSPIRSPGRVFSSVIEAQEGVDLYSRVRQFLTGFAGVRIGARRTVSPDAVESAKTLANEIFDGAADDIRASTNRNNIIRAILSICTDPAVRLGKLFRPYASLPEVAITLLLNISKPADSQAPSELFTDCLRRLTSVLEDANKDPEALKWADSLIGCIARARDVVTMIHADETLRNTYLDCLKPLLNRAHPDLNASTTLDLYLALEPPPDLPVSRTGTDRQGSPTR